MSFTYSQNKALSIIPHITGPFSFLGSSCILWEIIRDRNTKWSKPYHRLLFVMSFFDVLSSIALGLSTWPIPAGSQGVYAPLGTTGTCSAQAFFIQANIASPLYNFCLSLYYLFLVKYNISEAQISHKIEPWMHGLSVAFALGTSFVCLGLQMFNDSSLWCWINALPKGCDQSYQNNGETTCTRGDNAEIFRWAFFFAPLWAAIVGTMATMYMLWRTVRQQENRAKRWKSDYMTASQFAGGVPHEEAPTKSQSKISSILSKLSVLKSKTASDEHATTAAAATAAIPGTAEAVPSRERMRIRRDKSVKTHRKSSMVMWQAFRYVGVFWLTWLFGSLNRLLQLSGRNIFWVMSLHAVFVPLQGFFNFLVYKYPKYYKWKEARRKAKKQKQREGESHTTVAYNRRFSGMSMNSSHQGDPPDGHNCRDDDIGDDDGDDSQDGVIRTGVTLSKGKPMGQESTVGEEKSPDV